MPNFIPQGIRGKKIALKEIEAYQRKLYTAGMAPIPESYISFLARANGMASESWRLYGITEEEDIIKDIFTRNTVAGISQNTHIIFLGDSLTEYLCYEWYEKSYVCRYKADLGISGRFTLLSEALRHFTSI